MTEPQEKPDTPQSEGSDPQPTTPTSQPGGAGSQPPTPRPGEAPRWLPDKRHMADSKQRIEAFSDGVVAIIITIMVLGIRLPEGTGWADVRGLLKDIFIFLASFAVVGMFWDRHRKMLAYMERVSDKFAWRNLLFLFVLSVIPIFTRWVMLHPERTVPVLGYGVAFLAANFASTFLFAAAVPLFNDQARRAIEMHHSQRLPMIAIGMGIVLIAAGAFLIPQLASWLLVGFPILLALLNQWFEQPDMKHKHIESRRRERFERLETARHLRGVKSARREKSKQ